MVTWKAMVTRAKRMAFMLNPKLLTYWLKKKVTMTSVSDNIDSFPHIPISEVLVVSKHALRDVKDYLTKEKKNRNVRSITI